MADDYAAKGGREDTVDAAATTGYFHTADEFAAEAFGGAGEAEDVSALEEAVAVEFERS